MSEVGDTMNGQRRSQLEQRAEVVRARLERRLDELDERRDHLLDLAKKATRPPVSVVVLGAATAVGVVLVASSLRRHRPGPTRRMGAAMLGVPARKPEGFLVQAFKRAALALVATVIQRVSQRGLDRLLPETPPPALPEPPAPPQPPAAY